MTSLDEQTTADAASAASLSALAERLPELVNGNASLLRRGQYVTHDVMLEIGTRPFYLSILQGQITSLVPGPVTMRSWSFAIRGSEAAWRKFWQPLPSPGYHDLFALTKRGEFRIDGDFRPLMTNLLYFKGVLAAPRALTVGPQ